MTEFAPAYVYGPKPEPAPIADVPEGCSNCDGCRGDGIYYGAGSVVNGHFVGFKGTCYRCGGKGFQTARDVKRNRYYDAHRIVRL